MIQVNNLTYDYADKRALSNVTFEIKEGAITALVGPNGSGKTTLLRSLAALAKPLSGEIYVNGHNAFTHPREVHLQVGFLQDLFGLYDDLSVLQALEFTAHSRLLPGANIDESMDLAIKRSGVESFKDKKISTLSRGMRQRVGIAQAIIHQPKVLLLDEPASGLDPEARYALSHLLLELGRSGMTIIVSSHILAELEDYSSEMLVIQDGKVIEHRSLKGLTEHNNHLHMEILFTDTAEKFTEMIVALTGVTDVEGKDKKIRLKLDEYILSKRELLKKLMNADLPVEGFVETKVNLQDEYIKTVSNYKQTKAK